MPFGLKSTQSPYRDLEHAPLSAQDDDDIDDGMPLPPYSDTPPSSKQRNGSTTNGYHEDKNGRHSNGDHPQDSHKAINVSYDEYHDGYGEGDWAGNGGMSSATPSKYRRASGPDNHHPTRYYRGGLVCAYIKHWLTCQCCDCCAEYPSSSNRNIGGDGSYGPSAGRSSKCSRCGGMKRCFMVLFYLVLLVVILLCASAIGYIIAQDGSPFKPDEINVESAGDSTGGNANIKPNGKQMLSPPPDLHDICSDWITTLGRETCQAECDNAKCCTLPVSDRDSCWQEQAQECATYRSACMALELYSGGRGDDGSNDTNMDDGTAGSLSSLVRLDAPKTSYLDQICSASYLQTPTGFNTCSETCRPSRCCHPEIFKCDVAPQDHRWCDAYEKPCATVAESWRGSGHAVATSSSSSTSAGGGGTKTTTTSNQAEVIQKCNSANLNPPHECIIACHPAACCFKSTEYMPIEQLFNEYYGVNDPMKTVDSCSSNVGFCQQYGACEHLNHLKDTSSWHENEVTFELDISSVCKAEYVAQFGALECSNVCQPAHCCFSGEYKCDDVQLGHLNCKDYSKCEVLYPTTTVKNTVDTAELFKMAKHIDEVCSEDSLGTGKGRSDCQSLCKDHLCCFDDGAHSCANDPKQSCLAYAGCETLVSTPEISYTNEKQTEDTGGVNVDEEVDEFITALENACSENSLKTLEGIQQCHNKCQTHLCCFTDNGDVAGTKCTNVHVDACNAYKPCERLVTPNAQNPLAPSPEIPDDLDKLAGKIEKACALPDNPYLIDQNWVSACHEVCASRLCCLVDARIGSNCRASVGTRECNAYGPCEVLINESGKEITDAKQVEEKFGDIETVCNEGVVTNPPLYDACEMRCNQRSCCFEEEPAYSCYHMEKDWCDEFEACSFVDFTFSLFQEVSQPSNPAPSPPQSNSDQEFDNSPPQFDAFQAAIEAACSAESLKSLSGIEQCYNKCQGHLCCVPADAIEDESFDCSETREEECNAYLVCEQLVSLHNSWNPPFDPYKVKTAVNDACNPLQDNTSPTESEVTKCHQVCEARLCCFTDSSNGGCVEAIGSQECDDYSACKVLIGGADRHSKSIDDVCNSGVTSDTHQLSECKEKCNERSCCFEDNPAYSCYHMDKDWCSEYEACKLAGFEFLLEDETNRAGDTNVDNSVESSPPDSTSNLPFKSLCTTSNLQQNWEDCKSRCQEYECCFLQENNCYDRKQQTCDYYYICEEFFFEEEEKEIKAMSNREPPSTTVSAQANDGESNPSNTNNDEKTFKTLCTTETLGQNWSTCKKQCEQYACCFSSNESCYKNKRLECDEYYICEEFYDEPFPELGSDNPESSNILGPGPEAEAATFGSLEAMNYRCAIQRLDKHKYDCSRYCLPYECCFSRTNDCYESNTKQCEDHDVCSHVVTSSVGVAPDAGDT